MSSRPRRLTTTLVTMPVTSSADAQREHDGPRGGQRHMNSAGFVFVFHCGRLCCSGLKPSDVSAANDVDHGEDDDPDGVDEVPVDGDDLKALGVMCVDLAHEAEDQRQAEHEEADDHVRCVQADQ